MKRMPFIIFLLLLFTTSFAQDVQYTFPVNYYNISIEKQDVRMAYTDVKPTKANGETVILFHGKNFNGFYWKDVIPFLAEAGYRVIVPDQIG
jgi:hypothetical protein